MKTRFALLLLFGTSIAHADWIGLPMSGGEPVIVSGATSQYWRGDKTWRTLSTDVRALFSGTSPITFDGATGAISFTASNAVLNSLLPSQAGNNGKVLRTDGTNTSWATVSGSGTVTSVGLTLPGEISVSGSPVTAAGTLTGSWASQTTNKVLASPNGSTGTPSFRALVAADIPSLDTSKLTTGTLAYARGGTGATAFASQRIPFSSGSAFTSDALFIYDSTNTRFSVGGSGTAAINGVVTSGSKTAISAWNQSAGNALQGMNVTGWTASLVNRANSSLSGASVGFEFGRGTPASPLQALSGDQLGVVAAQGYTGAATAPGFAGSISFLASENVTATANGGEIVLATTPNGTLTPVERIRVTNDGLTKLKQGAMIDTSTSQPTCTGARRGLIWLVQGGAGVADAFRVCMKDAADVYSWVTK